MKLEHSTPSACKPHLLSPLSPNLQNPYTLFEALKLSGALVATLNEPCQCLLSPLGGYDESTEGISATRQLLRQDVLAKLEKLVEGLELRFIGLLRHLELSP